MASLKIPGGSLEKKLDFIERVAGLFEELYLHSRTRGVQGIRMMNGEMATLVDALKFLVDASGIKPERLLEPGIIVEDRARAAKGKTKKTTPRQTSPAILSRTDSLRQRIETIGTAFGFDIRGYIPNQESGTDTIDFGKPLAHLHGKPYFIWRPHESIISDIEMAFERGRIDWRSRSIGPIVDSRGDIIYRAGGITIHDSLPGTIPAHGMSIEYPTPSAKCTYDTELTINYGFDCLEGFMAHVHVRFKDGKVVNTYGSDMIEIITTGKTHDTGNPTQTLRFVEEKLGIPSQQLVYYLLMSNLTDEHRRSVGVLAKHAQGTPTISIPSSYSDPPHQKNHRIHIENTTLDSGPVLPDMSVEDAVLTPPSLVNANGLQSSSGIFGSLIQRAKQAVSEMGQAIPKRPKLRLLTFANDEPIDLDRARIYFETIIFKEFSLEELLQCREIDGTLGHIIFSLQTSDGHSYTSAHIKHDYSGDYICVSVPAAQREILSPLAQQLKQQFNGSSIKTRTCDEQKNISADIELGKGVVTFMHARSAGEYYRRSCPTVSVQSVILNDVTLDGLKASGLPLGKVTYLDSSKLKI